MAGKEAGPVTIPDPLWACSGRTILPAKKPVGVSDPELLFYKPGKCTLVRPSMLPATRVSPRWPVRASATGDVYDLTRVDEVGVRDLRVGSDEGGKGNSEHRGNAAHGITRLHHISAHMNDHLLRNCCNWSRGKHSRVFQFHPEYSGVRRDVSGTTGDCQPDSGVGKILCGCGS